MSGDCCCLIISANSQRQPLLGHCDKLGCTTDAKYKTDCNHRFCERHVVRMGAKSVPDALKWNCLREGCDNIVDRNKFHLLTDDGGEQIRTYKEITGRINAEGKKWAAAGLVLLVVFSGGLAFIFSQS